MFLLRTFSLWDKQNTEIRDTVVSGCCTRLFDFLRGKTSDLSILASFNISAVCTVQLPSVNSIIAQLHCCVGTVGCPLTEVVNWSGATLDLFRSFQHLVFPQAHMNGCSMKSTWDICKINDLGSWDVLLSFSPESTQLFVVDQEIITEQRIHNSVSWAKHGTPEEKWLLHWFCMTEMHMTCVPMKPISIVLSFLLKLENSSVVSVNWQDLHLRRGRENCWPLWVLISFNDPPIGKLCLDHRRMWWRQYVSKRDAEPQTGLMRHTRLLANKVFPE